MAGPVVCHLEPTGPLLGTEADALDILSLTYGTDTDLVAIPVERLDPEFFRLASGVAGAFTQKLLNYRMRVAVVGDIAAHLAVSAALRDYVRESERGRNVWFVADRAELESRLGYPGPAQRDDRPS